MARQVAIKYSGVKDGKLLPIVLQVRTGAVDRGACIRDFSQYQSEVGLVGFVFLVWIHPSARMRCGPALA
jgi:hypothetical protein